MIGHMSIAAAAGSGKTYQLAHRYIRLLALEVAPEKIIALTFSRKAAGEIFDSIIQYLYEAASDPEKASTTAAKIEIPNLSCGDFANHLRALLQSLHRLQVGTLDSFCLRVVQSFPMELGIGVDFQVLDANSPAAIQAHEDMLLQLFDPKRISDSDRKTFLEAFKEATFGTEERSLNRTLSLFIESYRDAYLDCTDPLRWGNPALIWNGKQPWWDVEPLANPPEVASAACTALADATLHGTTRKSLINIAIFAGSYNDQSLWGKGPGSDKVWNELMAQMIEGNEGPLIASYGQKSFELPLAVSQQIRALLQHLVSVEIKRALKQTIGLHNLMHWYEELYDRHLRRQGRLTFNDIQFLLTHHNQQSGGALLSRKPDEDQRLYIDYRLHCELDHWLLDEFQDTSNLQWGALANLIDEIMQDAEETKSFFYVGDTKQAIYSWRGGNPRLFSDIAAAYEGQIEHLTLAESFRSCPPVIELVNAAFTIPKGCFPAAVLERWNETFTPHASAPRVQNDAGCAAFLRASDEDDSYAIMAELLGEMKPLERGITVAVLARSNDKVAKIVNALRAHPATEHMTIAQEGRGSLMDDALISVFISLLRYTLHPGDSYAWRHVQMTPLHPVLQAARLTSSNLPQKLLAQIEEQGMRDTLQYWGNRVAKTTSLSTFTQKRLGDLLLAATEFDAEGIWDAAAFLRFLEGYEKNERGSEQAIRVMTVHQSKGLGFDAVIVPELRGKSIGTMRDLALLKKQNEENETEWLLKNPRKGVLEADRTLVDQYCVMQEDQTYDDLCVLYVALTRARYGLYLIADEKAPSDTRFDAADFLIERLPPTNDEIQIGERLNPAYFSTGDPDWYTSRDIAASSADAVPESEIADLHEIPSQRQRLLRVKPSAHEEQIASAGSLFRKVNRAAMDFGSAVHAIFEQIAFYDDACVDAAIAAWEAQTVSPPAQAEEIIQHVRDAMQQREAQELLRKPADEVLLWREQSFEIVLDNQWITGTIDRAIIAADYSSATIIDFKSDHVPTEEKLTLRIAHHRPQLETYRKVLHAMFGIPLKDISINLLFTEPGVVRELD